MSSKRVEEEYKDIVSNNSWTLIYQVSAVFAKRFGDATLHDLYLFFRWFSPKRSHPHNAVSFKLQLFLTSAGFVYKFVKKFCVPYFLAVFNYLNKFFLFAINFYIRKVSLSFWTTFYFELFILQLDLLLNKMYRWTGPKVIYKHKCQQLCLHHLTS